MSDERIKKILADIFGRAANNTEAHLQYMEMLRIAAEHADSQEWAQKLLEQFAPHIGKMLSSAGCAAYRVYVDANYQTGEVQIILNAQYQPPDKKHVH